MRHVIVIAAGCLALAGCQGSKRSAEAFVRANLKDPDSAKFGDYYYNRATKRACLTVNARNSMGGYTGDEQVRLMIGDGGWVWVDQQEEAPDGCRVGYADVGIAQPSSLRDNPEDALNEMNREADQLEASANQADNLDTGADPENDAGQAGVDANGMPYGPEH